MAKPKEPINPFYVLVVVIGLAFAVTTFAYGTMTYRAVAQTDEGPGLMSLVDRYGVQTMGVELGLLGLATFGAMWLDGVRSRQSEKNQSATGDLSPTDDPGSQP